MSEGDEVSAAQTKIPTKQRLYDEGKVSLWFDDGTSGNKLGEFKKDDGAAIAAAIKAAPGFKGYNEKEFKIETPVKNEAGDIQYSYSYAADTPVIGPTVKKIFRAATPDDEAQEIVRSGTQSYKRQLSMPLTQLVNSDPGIKPVKISVTFVVEADGTVSDAKLKSDKPIGDTERAIIDRVKTWKYRPLSKRVTFTLDTNLV
jgi:hypothetical protein